MDEYIKDYLSKFDLDIRKSKYSRFIDQKVTPDVLSFISDCIGNIVAGRDNFEFTSKDLLVSDYFEKNVRFIFNKPSPNNPNTSNEYDKFINQPLRMLVYAHVLEDRKDGNGYIYKITSHEILQYISIKERNALNFLYIYLVKVLSDSGLLSFFERYRDLYKENKLDNSDLHEIKKRFQKFLIGNTKIKGLLEANRIFPKIINIYCYINEIPGTVGGNLSKSTFQFYELMYNRTNFRDLKKVKTITRQEADDLKVDMIQQNGYIDYQITRAMNQIKNKYPTSEVKDQWNKGTADYVHHIFPKHQFLQIAAYLENLIKLTSYQHFTLAHPKGNTHVIDKDYQLVCLLAKGDSILESMSKGEYFYSKESYIYVVNTGLSTNLSMNLNIKDVQKELNKIYQSN